MKTFKKTKTIETKQDFIRKYSKNLHKIISNDLLSYNLYGHERLHKNEILSEEIVKKVSNILGKNYTKIRVVEHDLYTHEFAQTIYLSSENNLNYSEAFAGSGEFAVVSLVKAIMDAPKKSLILLDEPEVSIHPGAQEKMLEFLAEQAYKHQHQIVFTTHSSSMLRKLPPEAIHVLYIDVNNITKVRSFVHAEEAFVEIGEYFEKKTIVVEDRVAKLVVDKILKDNNLHNNFDVISAPNGAEWIKSSMVVSHAIQNSDNVLFILDGDKRKDHIDPDDIPPSKNIDLGNIIQEQTGCNIKIPHKKDDENDKITKQREFLKYYKQHVFYFPVDDPEEMLWKYANENEDIEETDIVSIHDYAPDGTEWEQKYQWKNLPELFPMRRRLMGIGEFLTEKKPVMMTEYGGIAMQTKGVKQLHQERDGESWGYSVDDSQDKVLARYESLNRGLYACSFAGFCYTQLTDVKQEVNGLLDGNHRPKFDAEEILRINDERNYRKE